MSTEIFAVTVFQGVLPDNLPSFFSIISLAMSLACNARPVSAKTCAAASRLVLRGRESTGSMLGSLGFRLGNWGFLVHIDGASWLYETECVNNEREEALHVSRLTELVRSAGCGCKVGTDDLSKILGDVPRTGLFSNLIVGREHQDDAAAYQINSDQAVVFSNDFIFPVVDDAYTFGKIEACN